LLDLNQRFFKTLSLFFKK